MTDTLHVAFDLDNVVLDFTGGVREAVQREFGVEVPEFEAWDFKDLLDPIIGRSWWKWMKERDWLWPNFPAVEGAIGGIGTVRDDGHYVELVTAKPKWAEYATWKWLGKWRPPVNRVTIVGMGDRKVDFTDADLIVDDKPEITEDFAADGRVGVLYSTMQNVKYEGPVGVYRANGWSEVVQLVRREARRELE